MQITNNTFKYNKKMSAFMITKENILSLVFESIDDLINDSGKTIKINKNENEPLYGKGGSLDSIDLVNFVVMIEEKIESQFNIEIIIGDEDVISMENSPFQTIGSLVDYIYKKAQ